MQNKLQKRLFFGCDIHAPWPPKWPEGRLVSRHHVTLAFLGSVDEPSIEKLPLPSFQIGPCGFFDQSLPLPEANPRLIAWHIRWFDAKLAQYQKRLVDWLKEKQFPVDERQWLSHVTVCRDPKDLDQWTDLFEPLPCFAGSLHLYESLGHSNYRPLWSHSFFPPFEEIEHTADVAFRIIGENLEQIYEHAFLALAFKDPSLLTCWENKDSMDSLEEIVILLNRMIAKVDHQFGSPFKAVSFHGQIEPFEQSLIQWEMIVDI